MVRLKSSAALAAKPLLCSALQATPFSALCKRPRVYLNTCAYPFPARPRVTCDGGRRKRVSEPGGLAGRMARTLSGISQGTSGT